MVNVHSDQQKFVWGSTYTLSSCQVHCTIMISGQIAVDLHIMCATFITFRVFEAFLVRIHELVLFRMVAAETVAVDI